MRFSSSPAPSRVFLGALSLALLPIVWTSCGEPDTESVPGDAGVDDADAADAGADDADAADADVGPDELPCDVRAVLEARCASCHSSPPAAGATFSLISRFDFLKPSSVDGENLAQRSVARMKAAIDPMPPSSEPPAAVAQVSVIEQWITAGTPAGTCGALPAKPVATTCASGSSWDQGDKGSALMNPGLPCRKCHQLQIPELAYFFAGTVFPSFHEQDLCNSPPPAEARIEILDESGAIALVLLPNEAGNFTSNAVVPGLPLPYRAQLVANGLVRAMTTLQQDGDCNGCHTEQGDSDAPGRLVWPTP